MLYKFICNEALQINLLLYSLKAFLKKKKARYTVYVLKSRKIYDTAYFGKLSFELGKGFWELGF